MKFLYLNKAEWLWVTMLLVVLFGVLSNWFSWAVYGMYISFIYPACLSLVMIFYAIKNTINDLK